MAPKGRRGRPKQKSGKQIQRPDNETAALCTGPQRPSGDQEGLFLSLSDEALSNVIDALAADRDGCTILKTIKALDTRWDRASIQMSKLNTMDSMQGEWPLDLERAYPFLTELICSQPLPVYPQCLTTFHFIGRDDAAVFDPMQGMPVLCLKELHIVNTLLSAELPFLPALERLLLRDTTLSNTTNVTDATRDFIPHIAVQCPILTELSLSNVQVRCDTLGTTTPLAPLDSPQNGLFPCLERLDFRDYAVPMFTPLAVGTLATTEVAPLRHTHSLMHWVATSTPKLKELGPVSFTPLDLSNMTDPLPDLRSLHCIVSSESLIAPLLQLFPHLRALELWVAAAPVAEFMPILFPNLVAHDVESIPQSLPLEVLAMRDVSTRMASAIVDSCEANLKALTVTADGVFDMREMSFRSRPRNKSSPALPWTFPKLSTLALRVDSPFPFWLVQANSPPLPPALEQLRSLTITTRETTLELAPLPNLTTLTIVGMVQRLLIVADTDQPLRQGVGHPLGAHPSLLPRLRMLHLQETSELASHELLSSIGSRQIICSVNLAIAESDLSAFDSRVSQYAGNF